MTLELPRPDGMILHGLKELPAWCVLFIVFVMMVGVYLSTGDGFIQRLLDGSMGALFTALVSNRARTPTVTANKIETGDILPGIPGDSDKKNLGD